VFFLDRQHGWIEASDPNGTDHILVFRTTDGGTSWTRGTLTLPPDNRHSINASVAWPFAFWDRNNGWVALTNTIPTPILFTSDGGATWHDQISLAPPDVGDHLSTLTFTSRQDGWAVIEHDIPIPNGDRELDYLVQTKDGGTTWTRVGLPAAPNVSSGGPLGAGLGTPRFLDAHHAVMPAFSSDSGRPAVFAYVTTDGGQTWTASTDAPFGPNAASPIFDFAVVSPTTWGVLSVNTDEIAMTTYRGASWTVFRPEGVTGAPAALDFSTVTDGWAMTCDRPSSAFGGPTGCAGRTDLYRTTNGGRGWTLVLSTQSNH
jgi:hypothetical protein